ncbi:acyl-CoA dehydrogenase family protein [Starkeya koreensis]|uniref:Acyl-CoA dehydrogenase family protein n=1 Tax=Ancylobacter koreensis TaxID=266121 RepID=A0ABT0DKZ2_9HYPH|nr:acyl-CoA dehydrogenase family protein [Ancylobacter koreensis]MCK0207951.1 acyl-CoA dehydrogenase family protein [Ancylobacter koreensis]
MLERDTRRLFTPALRAELGAIAARAAALDADDSFPDEDVAGLAATGTLAMPFAGGEGATMDPDDLMETLRAIGHASLPLGRLFEGHVNAAALLRRYGTPRQREEAARRAQDGALFGVWNTEATDGVRLVRRGGGLELEGRKIFASGAGHVASPLITACDEAGDLLMVLLRLDGGLRADLSGWKAHGMRASASGSYSFSGLPVTPEDIIGGPGDYHRQPHFSAGAWRFCAVQLGGIERLVEEGRAFLRRHRRDGDPHQRARMGEAAIAAETARLWVERAARLAEAEETATEAGAAEDAVAYVYLTRCAVERSGLEVMEAVQRSIGLAAFLRPSPVERLCRDLATYLRQPAPDRMLCEGAAHVLGQERPLRELWR